MHIRGSYLVWNDGIMAHIVVGASAGLGVGDEGIGGKMKRAMLRRNLK